MVGIDLTGTFRSETMRLHSVLFVASTLTALGFVASAPAQTKSPLALLAEGQIAAVETSYSDLQRRFEAGKASEMDLLDAYMAFYQREDRYTPQLNAWIAAYPKSASAYAARGVYFRRLGDARRGGDYIDKVPPENLRYMEQMHALAIKDLTAALAANPKSYIAALHLLNIAVFAGDDLKAFRYLNVGNEILPTNLLIRARYLISLTPKWGGSWKEMEVFIGQQKANGASADRVEQLRSIMANEMGRVAQEAGEEAASRQAYTRALELSKSGGAWFRNYYLKASLQMCRDPNQSSKEYCR